MNIIAYRNLTIMNPILPQRLLYHRRGQLVLCGLGLVDAFFDGIANRKQFARAMRFLTAFI
jgi:hypothetical protein